jgi:hypothetical protein
VPEPTGGENPFAEIIDLFREAAPEPDASADEAATAVIAAVEPVPAKPGPPVTRRPRKAAVAPAPSRRRGLVLLLPVALLALTAGATAAVMHEQDSGNDDAGRSSTPLGPPTTPAASSAASVSAPSPAKPAAQQYSRALDRLAAAQTADDLAATARRLSDSTADLHAATSLLARAEATHFDALVALGTLDATTTSGLTSYPRLAAAASNAARAVAEAADGNADVPDPSVATGNVATIAAGAVADGLDTQVGRLAGDAADARLTAQLRIVAAQAKALVPAATHAAKAGGDTATQAAADAQALQALAGLSVIDADHLGSWTALRTPLEQALTSVGVGAASADVKAIDAMVAAAQKKIDAWEAKVATTEPGASATPGAATAPTPAQIKQAQKAAKAAAQAIDDYTAKADALVDTYARDIATMPQVSPGQEPSFELAARFNTTSHLLETLVPQARALRAPAGMTGARAALESLVVRGRTAATAGQAMAVSAANCDPAARVCVLGAMKEWPAYKRAVAALGSSSSVRGTIAHSAGTAKAAAAAKASAASSSGEAGTAGLGSTTTSKVPPKPVV